MSITDRDKLVEVDVNWAAARAGWARKLGRLRLDAEPLEEQIQRHRSAWLAMAAIAGAVAIAVFAIFAAFERLLIGLGVAVAFWLPIVALAWLDLRRTAGRARSYEQARLKYLADREEIAAVKRSDPSTQD